jgi:hypothetical protein
MSADSSDQRTRFYNRVVRAGLIGSAVSFGSLIVLLMVPFNRNIGLIVAGAAVFVMVVSAVAMVAAIAARDIPAWKSNRWRFSIRNLFSLIFTVSLTFGSIVAAERGASLSQILLAVGALLVVSIIVGTFYINWARARYFNAMDAQGRFRDWSAIAAEAGRGKGTLIVGTVQHVPTVWWSDRRISAPDDASTAIETDALLTICPTRKNISNWLKATFPEVSVVELDTGKKTFFS